MTTAASSAALVTIRAHAAITASCAPQTAGYEHAIEEEVVTPVLAALFGR